MKFDSAAEVEQVTWYMRVSDWPRANNRALIDNLFNGFPPYTPDEWARMKATSAVNVNFLESTKIAADARMQYQNAFLKPGNFFTVQLEHGDRNHRQEWSNKITEKLSRVMKKSLKYRECKRNIFAQLVLHGVGPQLWSDRESWVPTMQMMGDVLVPTQTLLTMENLSYFAVYRRYTPGELWRKTHGPRVDPAWNIKTAEACCKWAHEQWGQTTSQNDGIWAPERWAENMKEMAGMWSSDAVPTINAFDFYYLHNEGKDFGWRRKIILDSPSVSPKDGSKPSMSQAKNFLDQDESQFLYDGGKRNYAPSLDQIIHFQFADGSVVAPFRYHSVRSLGFLLYSVCHLQNRMRCKLNEAVFEAMQQYLQGINPDDSERATKIDLIDKGILPDGVRFVPQNERWQVNEGLVMNGIALNRQSMSDNSSSFTQNFGENAQGQRGPEKTATQIAAEVNSANSLIGSMLQTAYGYAEAEYREIARRFCIKNSKDKDVREFRLACLKEGVPEELLNHELWDISVTKVMGSGNKQVELGQAQMLMGQIDRLDPDSQRSVLRQYVFSVTDDEAMAQRLVPTSQNSATDSVIRAQMAIGTLLEGVPMALVEGGINRAEYAASLVAGLQAKIALLNQLGGTATQAEIIGLQNLAGVDLEGNIIQGNGVANHLEILARNKASQQDVKILSDALGKSMNEVKAFQQRLDEQQQSQQEQSGITPEAQSKIISAKIVADTKAQIMQQTADQKAAHKDAQFQQKLAQQTQAQELEAARAIRSAQVETSVADLKAASDIRNQAEKNAAAPEKPNAAA